MVNREPVKKSSFRTLACNGSPSQSDLFERAVRQQKRSASSELIHDVGCDWQSVIRRRGRIDRGEQSRTPVFSCCSPGSQVPCHTATVIETGLIAARVEREDSRVDPQLLGDVGDQCGRRALVDAESPARIAHEAELHGEPELIVRSPTDLGLEAVLRGQSVVSDQAFLIIRDAEQSLSLLRGQKLPALHTLPPAGHNHRSPGACVKGAGSFELVQLLLGLSTRDIASIVTKAISDRNEGCQFVLP